MANYEEMYSEFRLDEETKRQLNKFASRKFPFEECTYPVFIETVISGANNEKHKDAVLNHAELV